MRGGGAGRGKGPGAGRWGQQRGRRDGVWTTVVGDTRERGPQWLVGQFASPPPPRCLSSHHQPLSELLGIRVKLGTDHEGEMKEKGFLIFWPFFVLVKFKVYQVAGSMGQGERQGLWE